MDVVGRLNAGLVGCLFELCVDYGLVGLCRSEISIQSEIRQKTGQNLVFRVCGWWELRDGGSVLVVVFWWWCFGGDLAFSVSAFWCSV